MSGMGEPRKEKAGTGSGEPMQERRGCRNKVRRHQAAAGIRH